MTFGPTKDKNFKRKINKKIKTKALFMLLSQKLRDGELLFLDRIDVRGAKTKNAKEILQNISKVSGFEALQRKKQNAAYIYMPERNIQTERGFNNLGNVSVAPVITMNSIDLAMYKYVIIVDPVKSVAFLEGKIKHKIIPKT